MQDVIAGSNGGSRVTKLPVVDENPLVDHQLERVIIASCLYRPHYLMDIDLSEHDFFGAANKLLWRAVVGVYADEGVVDSVRLRSRLLDNGEFKRAGGDDALTELVDSYVEVLPLPTTRLKRLAVQRRMCNAAKLLAEHIADAEACAKYSGELVLLREQFEALSEGKVVVPGKHRLDELWLTVGERG